MKIIVREEGARPTLTSKFLKKIIFARVSRSENGMSPSEMSPSRASLAAESAAEFPLMPTWPGTQLKTISFPSLVDSICSFKFCIRIGWSDIRSDSDERESDNIRTDLSLEWYNMSDSQKNSSYFPGKTNKWDNMKWVWQISGTTRNGYNKQVGHYDMGLTNKWDNMKWV